MEIVILTSFRDKDNFAKIYNVGEVLDIADLRAEDLILRGIAKEYKPEAPVVEPEAPVVESTRRKRKNTEA